MRKLRVYGLMKCFYFIIGSYRYKNQHMHINWREMRNNNKLIQFLGKSVGIDGKLPLRRLPMAAVINWMAESTVVFTSFASPTFGHTSTTSKPRRRPLSKTLSIIRVPSRSVKPPGTVWKGWENIQNNRINWKLEKEEGQKTKRLRDMPVEGTSCRSNASTSKLMW